MGENEESMSMELTLEEKKFLYGILNFSYDYEFDEKRLEMIESIRDKLERKLNIEVKG